MGCYSKCIVFSGISRSNPSTFTCFGQQEIRLRSGNHKIWRCQFSHPPPVVLAEVIKACQSKISCDCRDSAVVMSHGHPYLVCRIERSLVNCLRRTRSCPHISDSNRNQTRIVVILQVIHKRFCQVEVRSFCAIQRYTNCILIVIVVTHHGIVVIGKNQITNGQCRYNLLCFRLINLTQAHSGAQQEWVRKFLPLCNITTIENICGLNFTWSIQCSRGGCELGNNRVVHALLCIVGREKIQLNVSLPCFCIGYISIRICQNHKSVRLENSGHIQKVASVRIVGYLCNHVGGIPDNVSVISLP